MEDGEDEGTEEDIYDDMDDGDGCAEIWEKLSRRRKEERSDD